MEFYKTPEVVTDALLDLNFINDNHYVLEPCAGIGNMIGPIQKRFNCHITAIEIDLNRYNELCLTSRNIVLRHCDFLWEWESESKFDRIIMNPPFSRLTEFVLKAREHLHEDGRLACLVPFQLFTGIRRYNELYSIYRPTEVWLFNKRYTMYNFNVSPAMSAGIAWAIWEKETSLTTSLNWIAP